MLEGVSLGELVTILLPPGACGLPLWELLPWARGAGEGPRVEMSRSGTEHPMGIWKLVEGCEMRWTFRGVRGARPLLPPSLHLLPQAAPRRSLRCWGLFLLQTWSFSFPVRPATLPQ